MRIRKRFLSLSAAISAPPSLDLLVANHYHSHQPLQPVQRQELHPNKNIQHVECLNYPLPQSSTNHTSQIGLQSSIQASSSNHTHPTTPRKESMLCEEGKCHDLVLKGWFEGDKLVPVKKKRGSFGRRLSNDVVVQDNMQPKAKKNDKGHVAMGSKKKEKKEGVIMEGSRCSRVNGRGWRCSQQTLVGYSLCDHHLGKGRLRSMTSVRGRTVARKEQQHTKERKDNVVVVDDDDDDDEDDDEEFKDWDVESMSSSSVEGMKVFSKKTKLGVVKARSLSSLLSQMSS